MKTTIYRTTNGRTNEVTFSDRCPNLRELGADVYRIDRLTLDTTVKMTGPRIATDWARQVVADSVIAVEVIFAEVAALDIPSLDELDGIDPFQGTDLTAPIPYALTARALAERVA